MEERPILFNGEMIRALLDGRKTQTRRILKPQPKIYKNGAWEWGAKVKSFSGAAGTNLSDFPKIAVDHNRIEIGDRLWCRETFALENTYEYHEENLRPTDRSYQEHIHVEWGDHFLIPHYRATEPEPMICEDGEGTKWIPSIFMPRWASRLTLVVTDVRVQRVQDISEADAMAEGVSLPLPSSDYLGGAETTAKSDPFCGEFQRLWNSINAEPKPKYGRDENGDKIITHYESYPWDGESGTFEHRGRPHIIMADPWIYALTFEARKCNIDQMENA